MKEAENYLIRNKRRRRLTAGALLLSGAALIGGACHQQGQNHDNYIASRVKQEQLVEPDPQKVAAAKKEIEIFKRNLTTDKKSVIDGNVFSPSKIEEIEADSRIIAAHAAYNDRTQEFAENVKAYDRLWIQLAVCTGILTAFGGVVALIGKETPPKKIPNDVPKPLQLTLLNEDLSPSKHMSQSL